MIFKINLTKRIDAKALLFDHKNQYKRYISLEYGLNEVEIDLAQIKFIRFKCEKKNTENLLLSDNIDILNIRYDIKRKTFNVDLDYQDKTLVGKYRNVYFTDTKNLAYRKRNDKKVTFYFSPNFKNKDVHLIVAFDSQNIYDLKHIGKYTTKQDPYGGWQMDTPITLSGKNFIVAGLDNADRYRTQELSPNDVAKKYVRADNEILSKGKLDDLGEFINQTVLPYLKKYNIIDCTICGASMGGLAAHYLGLKYPEIYDNVFNFSSACALYSDAYWKDFYKNITINPNQRHGIFQGEGDSLEKELAKGNRRLVSNLVKAGINKENIIYLFDPSLKHNEISWRYAFNYLFNELYNK